MQKFTILLSTFLACILLTFVPSLQAQICNPDTTYKTGGFYPANLPPGCIGQVYSETITIVVPTDTMVDVPPFGPITVPIDSIVILNVKNLPPGITYQCEPISCGFPGGASYCALLSGTPSAIYSDSVEVVFEVHTTLPVIGAFIQTDSSNLFEFNVFTAPTVTATGTDASCASTNGTASAMATGTGPFTYAWSNGDTTANIMNLAPGTYSVIASNMGGCSDTAMVTINSIGGATILGDSTVNAN